MGADGWSDGRTGACERAGGAGAASDIRRPPVASEPSDRDVIRARNRDVIRAGLSRDGDAIRAGRDQSPFEPWAGLSRNVDVISAREGGVIRARDEEGRA